MIREFRGRYRFLSNFYCSYIQFQDKVYPTAEHLYQALKTNNQEQREKIRLAATPGIAKRMGRKLKLRDDWEEVKYRIMFTIVLSKFTQNRGIRKELLSTGTTPLIEGNYWHDNYWGDCLCPKCAKFKGENQLGKILMKVRSKLQT